MRGEDEPLEENGSRPWSVTGRTDERAILAALAARRILHAVDYYYAAY
jgi:hypothetical protein